MANLTTSLGPENEPSPDGSGEELTEYTLWRASLDTQHGRECDAFLDKLKPDSALTNQLNNFRFADEPSATNTNAAPGLSAWPRRQFQDALQ